MASCITKRNVGFSLLSILAMWMMYSPLNDLLSSGAQSDYYSHIPLIPLASGYSIYLRRKGIFRDSKYSHGIGFAVTALGVLIYEYGKHQSHWLTPDDCSSLMICSGVVFWGGGFIFFFGTKAARMAIFPLLFLAFMIPVPRMLMDKVIYLLLYGSTEVTYILFGLTGIPVSREGFVFQLPGISIEIAKQCSGIRSSLALLIAGVLAAHLFLKSKWKKALMICSILPIAILKNGIRIVTLSALAIYVDEKFITQSFLHKSGGFVFFLPALGILGLILWGLRRTEVEDRGTRETKEGGHGDTEARR
jgi:exosortase